MIEVPNYHRGLIFLSFAIALMLEAIPLPWKIIWVRPAWTLLILIYWALIFPERFSVGSAALVGFFMDGLKATPLGEHAFILVCITYLIIKMRRLLNNYALFQQSLIIFLFVGCYQSYLFFIPCLLDCCHVSLWYGLGTIFSALLWPWVYHLLHR